MTTREVNWTQGLSETGNGFSNLLRRESQLWWGTRRWLVNLIFSLLGPNGLLAYALIILPAMIEAQGESLDARQAGMQLFFGITFLATAIGMVILLQDSIMTEKQTGTIEWVLSKPVSRTAFLVAKMTAFVAPMSILSILAPSMAAFLLFRLAGMVVGLEFWVAVLLLFLHSAFYLILTGLLSVKLENRTLVLAIGIGTILGGSLAVNLLGPVTLWTPWPLSGLAIGLSSGASLPASSTFPVVFTLVWCVLGIWYAIRSFNNMDL